MSFEFDISNKSIDAIILEIIHNTIAPMLRDKQDKHPSKVRLSMPNGFIRDVYYTGEWLSIRDTIKSLVACYTKDEVDFDAEVSDRHLMATIHDVLKGEKDFGPEGEYDVPDWLEGVE